MLTITYYFLQVILCSAIMMAYYLLMLRNKKFHQYNRFYLLSVAIIPWLIPFIKINIYKSNAIDSITPIQLVSLIADNNTMIEQTIATSENQFTWDAAAFVLYSCISGILLLLFIAGLVQVWKLLQSNSYKPFDQFFLVLTKADGTPFSFFKFIFWNTDIDLNTQTGKQILQHEITHVTEKHSADKLFIQLILIIGWPNPVFWLLKKELHLVHEFIADNKAVANGCTETLAKLLLTTAYPKQQFILSNPFFYSPIKRRIMMMSNNQHPKFSYIRRLIALPLLAIITLLFAFRTKDANSTEVSFEKVIEKVVNAVCNTNTTELQSNNPYHFKKKYRVVIDAGHGGYDGGAINQNLALREKEIALEIAKLVAKSNNNPQIEIVLTRNEDEFIHPQKRAEQSNKVNADLFISLHCNSAADLTEKGVVVYVAKKEKAKNDAANNQLASAIIGSLTDLQTPIKGVLTTEVGIWVLQNTNCPSALIECGYISNNEEAKKLASESYQQKIAASVLNGIQAYLKSIENCATPMNQVFDDTIPIMKKGDKVIIEKMHFEGKNGYTVDIKGPIEVTKTGKGNVLPDSILWIVNGKEVDGKTLEKLNPNLIESVNVLKGEKAKLVYGERGKHGVIEVFLKKGLIQEMPLLKEVPIEQVDSMKIIEKSAKKLTLNKAIQEQKFISGKLAL